MMPMWCALALVAWIVVPSALEILGLIRQPEVDVYERWVDLQLTRTYVQGYKGIG